MSTMTKTTVITWKPTQVTVPLEIKAAFAQMTTDKIEALVAEGKTNGIRTTVDLPDSSQEARLDWVDAESAQAWLDFVLTSLQNLYGKDVSYQSGVIEDIPI